MSQNKRMKLASRGKRLGAYCIDVAVPALAGAIFMIVGGIAMMSASMNYGYGYGYGYGFGYGYGGGPSGALIAACMIMLLMLIAYIVVQLVFFSKSKTIGKAALGLQVVSSKNGEPIGFWMMLFREWFVKSASAYVFCLGYIWVCVDDRNRGWHDKILDTYVVDLKESEALNASGKDRRPAAQQDAPKPAAPAAAEEPTITLEPVSAPAAEPAELDISYDDVSADTAEPAAEVVLSADETAPDVPAVDTGSEEPVEEAAAAVSEAASEFGSAEVMLPAEETGAATE